MKLLVAAGVLASATARADVAGELSAGAGADTTAPAGFATTSFSLAARIDRDPVPIFDRGLAIRDDRDTEDQGRMWIFTGLDGDDRDALGATLDGTLHVQAEGDRARAAWLAGRVWARGMGWQLGLRGDLQPLGDLRDPVWRSGRGVAQIGVTTEIPAMWALGSRRTQLLAWLTTIDLGQRVALDGTSAHDTGWDRAVTVVGARVQTTGFSLDLVTFGYSELGVATARAGDIVYGTSAASFDVDVVAARWKPFAATELSGYAGIAMRSPVSTYMQVGSSEVSTGPAPVAPRYWLELRHGPALSPGAHGYTASLGAGSWTRLAPDAHAVDDGQLVAASADWRDGRYRLAGTLEAGRLARIVVGDMAPPETAPVGARYLMGRGELQAALRLTPAIVLAADAWVERSDRDDPRWLVPATGAVVSHAGADVTAVYRFSR